MSERNWQEDWDYVQEYKKGIEELVIPTTLQMLHQKELEIREYWLQEIKSLREQLAHANCEWQREKSMRYSAIAREGQEKRRADEAEDREQKLKMFIEDLTKIDDGSFPFEAHERWKDIAARYLKQLYGDAA